MPNASFNVQTLIDHLERRMLDGVQPPATPIWGQLDATRFVRVTGLAAFWEQDKRETCRFEQYMEDLVTGFHGQQVPFVSLILGQRQQLQLYVGVQGAIDVLLTALRGTFPAIELSDQAVDKVGSALRQTAFFNHFGRLTGIPTLKAGHDPKHEGQVQQIERLLRGLYGQEWGYLVVARPVQENWVTDMARQGFEQIRQVSALVKKSVRIDANTTSEQIDRQAQYCVELLEKNMERLTLGKAQGMWQVEVYFFAANEGTLNKCKALLKAIFAGEKSIPDPLRTFNCVPSGAITAHDPFVTLLNSHELSILTQLPREEMPGYAVREYARFGVDASTLIPLTSTHFGSIGGKPVLPAPASLLVSSLSVSSPSSSAAEVISIGKILDGSVPTGNWYTVARADLAKHGLVVGVTGGGKTNTIFYLLDKLWNKGQGGVPFLVIEPAKTEYRDLRTAPGFDHLRIFTLGDERWAPFRLNPFEFEIADVEHRIHVQTHIDYLKNLFNAAFILYAPMPYVLETCLHEIYQDKGWDLTTSQNRRLPLQQRGKEAQWALFPTLTELYDKVDEVVDRLGYEERIQMDVKAGLKARLGSLRLGGKGLMLDVRHSIPMRELLSQPTVLEFERIGNDDEKAFIMGLLLTRLYEFRVVQAMSTHKQPPLQHVTVIEEAHRLLKNVPTDVGTEEANVKGQSVETFANMLSEIRAYGQGVLIAEQVPTKLATDAIKNTNLKIMHRIVAEDDREVMGGTMNLDERQQRHVSTLRTGQAVVYAEGADKPFLVKVYNFKGGNIKGRLRDKQLQGVMQPFFAQYARLYEPVAGYNQYIRAYGEPVSEIRDLAFMILNHHNFAASFSRYFLSLIEEPRQAVYGYHQLIKLTTQAVRLMPKQVKSVALYVILQALASLLEERARRYGWYYNIVETIRQQLAAILCDIALNFANQQHILNTLVSRHEGTLRTISQQYQQLCQNAPIPYVGCAFCTKPCLYRYDVAPLMKDRRLNHDFKDAVKRAQSDQQLWQNLAQLSLDAAKRVVQGVSKPVLNSVAICYAAQIGPSQEWSSTSQKNLVKNIKTVL